MKRLNGLDGVALFLAILGAINWGLIGLFNFDLVATLFGDMTTLTRVVYSLIGLSGVYLAVASPWFARMSDRLEDRTRIHTEHHAT